MSLSVLVVDDDPGIRELTAGFLQGHGYLVDTAGDAREMEQALERGPVDLIVLDVMLPGMNGIDVCKAIRETSTVPIVMPLSALR